ncbi:PREDICTED: uncharacterized protein LOC104821917 [Tarenaya hassleriana]|uniref:uncharacterized protein LOC104821917 n=1 Tax=Tarenaya hassleriana TaxID=28532 RepID=UPI00053CA45F|nr:PREDICTED: uncharacterized protein LOC104821917 [Tarenaya hassleriana]
MVLPGERDYMETGHERSKTLHNFTLPNLKWGSQRHLRCMRDDSESGGGSVDHRLRRRSSPLKLETSSEVIPVRFRDGDRRSNDQNRRLRLVSSRSAENGSEEGIEEFREKIMSDLRTVADKMTESIFRKEALGCGEEEEQRDGVGREKGRRKERQEEKQKEREVSAVTAAAAAAEVKPWNLRTRRAACKAPTGNSNGSQYNGFNHHNKGLKIEERSVNPSPLINDSAKSPRVRERGGATAAAAAVSGADTKERPKFSVPLKRKEIEEDFMEVMGHRLPRRPKKRPRTVQKQLDFLCPGLYLTEVTLDTYKVPEPVENGKR